MQEKNTKYILFILLQSVLYGIGNPVTKIAYDGGITPLWLLTFRFFIAFATCLLLFGKRVAAEVPRADVRKWLPSAGAMAGAYICCNIALGLTSATNVGFLLSLPVLFTPFLAPFFRREKYDVRVLPVQIISVVGLFLLCCGDAGFSFGFGEVLGLVDALCLALALLFSERALTEMDGTTLTTLQVGVTFAVSLVLTLCMDSFAVVPQVEPRAWLVVVYLALGCSVLAYFLQNSAVMHLSAATVSVVQCTQPILTALISFLVLHENLTFLGITGAVLILAALLLDARRRKIPVTENG